MATTHKYSYHGYQIHQFDDPKIFILKTWTSIAFTDNYIIVNLNDDIKLDLDELLPLEFQNSTFDRKQFFKRENVEVFGEAINGKGRVALYVLRIVEKDDIKKVKFQLKSVLMKEKDSIVW